MLSFMPYYNPNESNDDIESSAEYLFLLDRSGSMDGNRIKLAKKAAVLFLKSLPCQCLFNIISFGHEFLFMHQQSLVASSDNINTSINILNDYDADMGGTNIFSPLSAIFHQPLSNNLPRFIFLLTDGDVDDIQNVIQLIKDNSSCSSVNGFGISGANKQLIKGASEAGRGLAYFIENVDELGKHVISALSQCLLPCISNFEINWEGDSTPKEKKIGILKYGQQFNQYIVVDSIYNNMPSLK